MKKQFTILTILVSALLLSCEPNIVFESPMPPKGKTLNAIPAEFIGVYLCESDSAYMIVSDDVVYREYHYKFNTTFKKIEDSENCAIEEGQIKLPYREECVPFEHIEGDSIAATLHEIDTLFNFRKNEVLKLYKGRLFINVQDKNKHWMTQMVTPMEERWLKWEMIELPDELENLDDITTSYKTRTTKRKRTQFIVNPTHIEFEKLLIKKYLSECDILIPQSPQLLF